MDRQPHYQLDHSGTGADVFRHLCLLLAQPFRWVLCSLLGCGAALALVSFALAPVALAHPVDSGATIQRISALDSPAAVRIITEIDAQVICRGCASGGGDYTFPSTTQVYPDYSSGSGAFISADGYILTAEHVVDQDCTDSLNAPDFVNLWEQDLTQNYQNYGFSSSSNAQQFAQNELNQNAISLQCVGTPSTKVFPSVAYTGPLQDPAAVISYPMTQIVASSPYNQQDTAIIKVSVPHDMPYLILALPSSISIGETITGIAYPGDADQSDFTSLLDPTQSNADVNSLNSLLTPSIDTGQITTQQTRSDGTLTYQTSGIGSYGSSGGPAVDQQGRIVGFFDAFTTTSAQNNQRVIVLVASSVAATYAKQAGLAQPDQGSVMPLWTAAINDYYATGPCHYGRAYSELSQLREQHPEFGGVQSFYMNAEQKQTPQACAASLASTHNQSALPLLIGGGLSVVALLVAGGVGFFILRRKRVAQREAATNMVAVPATVPMVSGAAGADGSIANVAPSHLAQHDIGSASNPSSGPFISGSMPSLSGAHTPISGSFSSMPTPIPLPSDAASRQAQPADMRELLLSTPAPSPATRVCYNGHDIASADARFCPHCGAPVRSSHEPV